MNIGSMDADEPGALFGGGVDKKIVMGGNSADAFKLPPSAFQADAVRTGNSSLADRLSAVPDMTNVWSRAAGRPDIPGAITPNNIQPRPVPEVSAHPAIAGKIREAIARTPDFRGEPEAEASEPQKPVIPGRKPNVPGRKR